MRKRAWIKLAIALLLCSCLIGFAAASGAGDEILDIYGNANEDDTIDWADVNYIKQVIFGKKPYTGLADANYDGKISMLDVAQTKLIILRKEKRLTLVDEAGRTVTVSKPVKKIAAGGADNAEIIRLLKAKDRIVAVDKSTENSEVFFPELSRLPLVNDHHEVNYEKMYELHPDIFITYAPASLTEPDFIEIVDRLEPVGIKVICLGFYKPTPLIKNVKKLGYILDKEEEAEEFIAFYEGIMNYIEERVEGLPEKDKPRVFYEYYRDYLTCAEGTGVHEYIVKAGGINIAAELPGLYPTVDAEWVIRQNPDIILRITYHPYTASGYGEDDPSEMEALRNAIINRSELAEINAIKNETVYVFSYEIGESPRHFVCIAYFAKWFHPELFGDMEPQAIHQEYLTRFQELDYDLNEHGVFVYPVSG